MSNAAADAGGSAFEAPGDARPRPYDNCYWLLPGALLAGQHPGALDPAEQFAAVSALLDAGIRQVVDLTHAAERLPDYRASLVSAAAVRRHGVQLHRLPITDYAVPDPALMRCILDTVQTALQAGQPLYLHCHGGSGRTGTVVGCLLVEHGYAPDQALALIARKWQVMAKRGLAPVSPETDAQRDFILNWVPGAGR